MIAVRSAAARFNEPAVVKFALNAAQQLDADEDADEIYEN